MPNTKVVGIIFPYILTPIPNLYDHSFPRYGQITFLTFRRPTTLTFDLKFWKYLSVTVYPYVICMPSFIMIGWEMAEILHFEILRKHGQTNTQTNTHTNKQTHTQTDMGITIPRPPPMGGEVINTRMQPRQLWRIFQAILHWLNYIDLSNLMHNNWLKSSNIFWFTVLSLNYTTGSYCDGMSGHCYLYLSKSIIVTKYLDWSYNGSLGYRANAIRCRLLLVVYETKF